MLETLDIVGLKDGRKMSIRRFTPPEQEYADGFKHFMRYLNDENTRSVGARSDGKYADCSVDRYFTGEIDGRIAGQVWYGWGHHDNPVANFGHVYVDPDFRGLGITRILMKYLYEDFRSSPVIGALCTCAAPQIAELYQPSGFHQIYPGSPRLYSPGSGYPDDFNDLTEQYYESTSALRVVPGSMEYRHEIDCLLMFTLEIKKIAALQRFNPTSVKDYQDAFYAIFNNSGVTMHQLENDYFLKGVPPLGKMASLRRFAASAITSYQDALFKQEDGRGQIFVVLTENGHCVGWSFCLSPLPDKSTVFFDYEIHPSYESFAGEIVRDTLKQWHNGNDSCLWAACPGSSGKITALSDNGFNLIKNIENGDSEKIMLMLYRRR